MARTAFQTGRYKRWLAATSAVVLIVGCGYPAAEPDNLPLITSLRTALSARNDAWLNANEEIIEKRHDEKELNDDAYSAFKKIIAQAREGDWKGAELESLKFQRAQRPTREQIERLPTEKG